MRGDEPEFQKLLKKNVSVSTVYGGELLHSGCSIFPFCMESNCTGYDQNSVPPMHGSQPIILIHVKTSDIALKIVYT